MATLQIELEDMGGTSWWAGVLATLASQEAWAPGMTKSLQDLCREIENDGWVEAGRGAEPWAFRYERPASG